MSLLLDPTAEREVAEIAALPRLNTLAGKAIGLLNITKANSSEFLDRLQACLETRGATVKRYAKATFTRPAATSLLQDIAQETDAVIEALAD